MLNKSNHSISRVSNNNSMELLSRRTNKLKDYNLADAHLHGPAHFGKVYYSNFIQGSNRKS